LTLVMHGPRPLLTRLWAGRHQPLHAIGAHLASHSASIQPFFRSRPATGPDTYLTPTRRVSPGAGGGPWLCSTFVRSLFQAVVVPSGFSTRVQPQRWITIWW
jgi:hypothetical protein